MPPKKPDTFNINTRPRDININSSESDIARYAYDQYTDYRAQYQARDNKIVEGEHRYRDIMPEKDFPWKGCSNVNVPITKSQLNTLHNNLINVEIGDKLRVKTKPLTNTSKKSAFVRQAIINNQLAVNNYRHVFEKTIFKQLMHGATVLGLNWFQTTITTPQRKLVPQITEHMDGIPDPVTGQITPVIIQDKEYFEVFVREPRNIFHPQLRQIDIFDIALDPDANCINRTRGSAPANWVVEKILIHDSDLKNPRLFTQSLVKNIQADEQHDKKNLSQIARDSDTDTQSFSNRDLTNSHLAYLMWKWVEHKGSMRLMRYVVLDNNGSPLLVKQQENPFTHYQIPLIWCNLNSRDDLFPISAPNEISEVQKAVNSIKNMHIDSNTLSLTKVFKVRNTANYDANQPIFPGAMISVNEHQDIEQMQMNDSGAVPAFEQERSWVEYSERATGVSPLLQGISGRSNAEKTATGVSVLRNASFLNIDIMSKYHNQTHLKELFILWDSLNQQFHPIDHQIDPDIRDVPEDLMRDVEQGLLRATIEDLNAKVDVEHVLAPDDLLKQLKRQTVIEFLQYNPQLSTAMGEYLQRSPEFIHDLTRLALDAQDMEHVRIPSPAEVSAEQAEEQKQAVQQEIATKQIFDQSETQKTLITDKQKIDGQIAVAKIQQLATILKQSKDRSTAEKQAKKAIKDKE